MTEDKHQPKSRGRPVEPELQEQKKNELIQAAFELLKQKSYHTITIRELADIAGTQSAMVSYYFGSKEGLFVAALEQLATKDISLLQQAMLDENPLKAFIRALLGILSRYPQISRFMVDELLAGDGPLREKLIDIFPRRMALILPKLMESQQRKGLIRDDLDPKWAAFSLMTMLISPFILKPVRDAAWSISDEVISGEHWADHIYQLFIDGACGSK